MTKIINLSILSMLGLHVLPVTAGHLSVNQMNINLDKCYQQTELVQQKSEAKELSIYACTKVLSNDWLSKETESNTRLNRGIVYMAQGQYEKAKKDFKRSISLNPNSYPAHVALAQLLYKDNDFVGALKHYDVAITLNSDATAVVHNRQIVVDSILLEQKNRLAGVSKPDSE